jgi:hypothetical protein
MWLFTDTQVLCLHCNVGGSGVAAIKQANCWVGVKSNQAFYSAIVPYVAYTLSFSAIKYRYYAS